MAESGFDMVAAIHPHWIGYLRLSNSDNAVTHDATGSRGTYVRGNGTLTVAWDDYPTDVFLALPGLHVHKTFLDARPALRALVFDRVTADAITRNLVAFGIPGTGTEVFLRPLTTDITIFGQIFLRPEYESPTLPRSARTIVDLGANIGLATVFFGLKYPEARLLAVEPEPGNFTLLARNAASLGDRVRAIQAAAWIRDGLITLHTETETGVALGAWGVQVSDVQGTSRNVTPCRTMTTLLGDAGFDWVDILKIDIEGAELELFTHGAEAWLPRIGLVIVETHDRIRPGSDAAVRRALTPLFEECPASGENLFFRRKAQAAV